MSEIEIPNEIKALAQSVKLTPLAWTIHPDFVVIVFVEGAKMVFERSQVSPMTPATPAKESGAKDAGMIQELKPIPSAPSATDTSPLSQSGSVARKRKGKA